MCTTTDEPSALNGTSKLPPIMKKKMLRMAASSFLYMPPMGMGRLHETFLGTGPDLGRIDKKST